MDQQQFEIWMQRMRPRLVTEAMKLLADEDEVEDTVQETVLKLWSLRGQIDKYDSADGLAIVIVRHLSLNGKRRLAHSDLPELLTERTPESELISKEESARLETLLQRLPDMQQSVLRMKHIDGLEVAEIARITCISEDAVRQNLSRARRKILKMFRK